MFKVYWMGNRGTCGFHALQVTTRHGGRLTFATVPSECFFLAFYPELGSFKMNGRLFVKISQELKQKDFV